MYKRILVYLGIHGKAHMEADRRIIAILDQLTRKDWIY